MAIKVHRLWLNNDLRNYHYLVECLKTKQTIVFDPFDVDLIMETVKSHDLHVTAIINTHEHDDHIAGNEALKALTNASIYAPNFSRYKADKYVNHNDIIPFANELQFRCYFTPGHTHTHFSYLLISDNVPHLFSGDTIFNAGAGHVYSGDVAKLYDSFELLKSTFSDNTLLYPGHDLFDSNLRFAQTLDQNNNDLVSMLHQIGAQNPSTRSITSLGQEKTYNPFLRLNNEDIVLQLLNLGVLNVKDLDCQVSIFSAIRELRNKW